MSDPSVLFPPSQFESVAGFGMTQAADGIVFRPTTLGEVKEVLVLAKTTGRQVTLRGAGRSYGDASIGPECLVLDCSRMNRILSFNKSSGEIECEPGVTIEQIWRAGLEHGFWPPVVSGTMFPTVAGALGMNIHGKNAYKAGPIGDHVIELDVLFPSGDVRTLPGDHELARAVISSAGLLGVITRAIIRLKPVSSGDLRVLPISAPNWDAQFAAFEEFESNADYMVSWIDTFSRGEKSGRGLFHAAWHTAETGLSSSFRLDNQDLPDTVLGMFPKSMVWRILKKFNNRTGMRFVNWAKHKSSQMLGNGTPHPQSLVAFSFLLDYVPNWRNAYLPGGFIQYQSFVPKESARKVFARQFELQQEAKLESFLAVLKRHKPDGYLFSHGLDGYSLALDFKVTTKNRSRLEKLAHEMNDLVIGAGGRFYFAKDSTLRPSDVVASLGQGTLDRYFALKAEHDPDGILTSGLAKRLELDPTL